jgi:sugar phosphate isomerase/epimerase
MQPCLHPATMRPGLGGPEIVRIGSHAGFHLMEASARGLITFVADDPNKLRTLLSEHNVTPIHCGWSAGLRSSRADFAAALPRTAEEMAFVAEYGCKGGTLVLPFRREPGVPDPDEGDTLDRIGQIAAVAAENGLMIVLEFVGLHIADAPAQTYRDLAATLDLLARVRQPNVGVLLDSYHWYLSGGTVGEIAAMPAGLPLFVHINDAPPGEAATLDDSMRLLPGEGVIDLSAFLGAIAARDYDGPVSVEVFSERLRALPPEEAARRAYDTTLGAITRAAAHPAG